MEAVIWHLAKAEKPSESTKNILKLFLFLLRFFFTYSQPFDICRISFQVLLLFLFFCDIFGLTGGLQGKFDIIMMILYIIFC